MNNSFCILPWIHIAVNAFGKNKPCCRFDCYSDKEYWDNYMNASITDAFYSKEANDLRDATLRGERIPGCHKCYFEEESGKVSMRQDQNSTYRRFVRRPQTNLIYLEIAQSNACNFSCLSCSSQFSSSWYKDDKLLNENSIYRDVPKQQYNITEIDWENIDLSKLEEIKILGGEPFHEPKNLELLKALDDINRLQHITIHTHTNASFIPNKKWLIYLKKLKKLTLRISLDGIEDHAEYIRYGTNWQKVINTCQFWNDWKKEYPHQLDLGYHVVVMVYNTFNLKEIYHWISQNSFRTKIKFDCLNSPEFLNISFLPEYWKTEIINYLDDTFIDRELIVKFMNKNSYNKKLMEKMIKYTKLLDTSRNNSVFKLNNILSDMFMKTDGLVKEVS